MSKKAPAPPPAPDYVGAASAEAAGNMQMARYQTDANRINQVNPYGALTYDRTTSFDQAAYDRAVADWRASGGKADNMPQRNQYYRDQWTQTETLDPRIQAALDSQLQAQQERSATAAGMLDRVNSSYAQDFNPTRLSDYLSGIPGVDTSRVGSAGTFSSDARIDPSLSYMGGPNTSGLGYVRGFRSGADINTDGPQFGAGRQDDYAKAAYESQVDLLRGDMDRADTALGNKLALQGLTPGTEASDNAWAAHNDSRARQLQSLASQSVLTGNQMSQADFASELAGFRAGNEAEQQQFGMDTGRFTNNLQQVLSNAGLRQQENQTQQQAFDQALARANFGNQSNLAQFGMDQATYDNALRALQLNSDLQLRGNTAQQQAFAQALQGYGANWQQEQTLRNLPLNEMNALLTGQQVQSNNFQPFAQQSFVGGPNVMDAVGQRASWDQGIWNQQAAQAAQGNAATGQAAGTAAAMYMMYLMSDKRLKKNVEKVGETDGGSNIYTWDWNARGKKLAGNQPTIGVLAQEHPEAARKTKSGYLAIDYSKIH